jgi:hypothetical protein
VPTAAIPIHHNWWIRKAKELEMKGWLIRDLAEAFSAENGDAQSETSGASTDWLEDIGSDCIRPCPHWRLHRLPRHHAESHTDLGEDEGVQADETAVQPQECAAPRSAHTDANLHEAVRFLTMS